LEVKVPQKKGDPIVVDTDEHPKHNTTIEKLAKLRTAFKKDGTVSAGNASGINDGSAMVILMSREKCDELGLKPLASIVSSQSPRAINCAAILTALSPEPQTLFIASAGTSTGISDFIATCLATFCPRPALNTLPISTSSIICDFMTKVDMDMA